MTNDTSTVSISQLRACAKQVNTAIDEFEQQEKIITSIVKNLSAGVWVDDAQVEFENSYARMQATLQNVRNQLSEYSAAMIDYANDREQSIEVHKQKVANLPG
jgi:uncharacterized protein YukE